MSTYKKDFLGGSEDKVFACNVEDLGSIPQSGKSPGDGPSPSTAITSRIRFMWVVISVTICISFRTTRKTSASVAIST